MLFLIVFVANPAFNHSLKWQKKTQYFTALFLLAKNKLYPLLPGNECPLGTAAIYIQEVLELLFLRNSNFTK